MALPHYDAATPLIPLHHQPALLVEHLQSLDLDPALLRPGSCLRGSQALSSDVLLSPARFLAMLANAANIPSNSMLKRCCATENANRSSMD